ncbi:hypothetical protein AVEN_139322-1 [Araneus ventricosus]|uniref:Uncharacterized protein n=1 Tax=Araneus ventricosus TaxID=182803 RepID=A0A4Y2VUA6_ARAVE|nr:hypothetical protein AVEN_60299-1 [Araneus ventricosus]GBO27980.1 hypothetical protein AVEN_139322-1 [Araneus ventricosus]
MGAERHRDDHETARMEISIEGFCSWTIMQDPTQQGTQKNAFVAWDGRNWITQPTDSSLSNQTFTFFHCIEVSTIETGGVSGWAPTFTRMAFLKLISRYDKCFNVGGEYVGK